MNHIHFINTELGENILNNIDIQIKSLFNYSVGTRALCENVSPGIKECVDSSRGSVWSSDLG